MYKEWEEMRRWCQRQVKKIWEEASDPEREQQQQKLALGGESDHDEFRKKTMGVMRIHAGWIRSLSPILGTMKKPLEDFNQGSIDLNWFMFLKDLSPLGEEQTVSLEANQLGFQMKAERGLP